MFAVIKNWIFDILFPVPDLPQNLTFNQTLFCSTCRARLANNVKICHRNSQYKLGAATGYDNEIVRRLIWQLKYRGRTGNAVLLSKLLITYIENCKFLPAGRHGKIKNFVLVPIPLSQKRLRQRGYNQAALISKNLAEKFKLPLVESALLRVKEAPPQAEIRDWDTRKKNVLGCFGVPDPKLVRGKNILLVDDVFTSGATMSAAAHELKDFGAKTIIGLVIAKAG